MPRPKTKSELLTASSDNFVKLMNFISELPDSVQIQEFNSNTLNRNIRDVLMHLYEWHNMLLKWYKVGMAGEKPDIPAKGYTWKTLPDLNKKILEKYKSTTLKEAKKKFSSSHAKLMKLIDSHSDEELFTKKLYKWTNTTSLAAYLISSTSSHYDWAYKLIKKGVK